MHRYLAVSSALALLVVAARAVAAPAVTATVPIGQRPVAVAVDPGDHRVYVADVGMGAVIPVDGARGTVEAPINIGGQPASLAVDSTGRRLFVGNRDGVSASVTVIDTASDRPRVFLPAGRRIR